MRGRLLTQPLTIQTVQTGTLDEYGDQIQASYGAPVSAFGFLEQRKTDEMLVDRDTVVSDWKCWLQAGTAIGHLDFITYNGQKFQVNGQPHEVWNARKGVVSHIEVELVVVDG
jgi:hypothetical protein